MYSIVQNGHRARKLCNFFIVYDVYRQLVLSVTSARHTCNIVLCNQNLGFVCHIFLLKLFNDFYFQKVAKLVTVLHNNVEALLNLYLVEYF